MAWNPQQYLKFAAERQRPGFDLLAQIGDLPPGPIYELGCGTGSHARAIASRWPDHAVVGIDNSPEMLAEAARTPSRIRWVEAEISAWQAPERAALVYSNATLHWLQHHEALFPRLLAQLAPAGLLAVQMPRNFDDPSQRLLREIARAGAWAAKLAPLFEPDCPTPSLLRPDPVGRPEFYYDLLAPRAAGGIELWETEYIHQLVGANAVLEWMRGTTLRPVLDALDAGLRASFLAAYGAALAAAFPRRADGKTLLHFRRLFLVARA
ncbi:MAG TPA: methyltransferase domain-containing protein [Stellaceae bacterium]|nr:methyltransferase domain-containing protein [Stellaceae bacterium]